MIRRLAALLPYYRHETPTPPPSRRDTWIRTCGQYVTAKLVTDDDNLALVWAESGEELAEIVPWQTLLVTV